MSEQNHPWCSSPSRDEAIRAAEDAAAAERTPLPDHRDLPAAVAELRERVGRLEAFTKKASIREAEPAIGAVNPAADASAGETDGLRDVRDSRTADNGLRTERVTAPWQRAKWDEALAIICDGGDWGRGNNFDHGVLGALVIWADKEMDRLTAERDAAIRHIAATEQSRRDAIRERDAAVRERDAAKADLDGAMRGCVRLNNDLAALRGRVAELESALNTAPAANAGGEQSQPPRGWLTSEEREAVENARSYYHAQTCGMNEDGGWYKLHKRRQLACEALLARSTPPKVKMPPAAQGETPLVRDLMWGQAIREAGGEVQDG